jgi:thioredoxin reductase
VKDIMLDIKGFAECWGISIIYCPYCHGYEYSSTTTGILANGDMGFEMCKLINNWTKDLTIFTNGKPTFTSEQIKKNSEHHIIINENEIDSFKHNKGKIENIIFKNVSTATVKGDFLMHQAYRMSFYLVNGKLEEVWIQL